MLATAPPFSEWDVKQAAGEGERKGDGELEDADWSREVGSSSYQSLVLICAKKAQRKYIS